MSKANKYIKIFIIITLFVRINILFAQLPLISDDAGLAEKHTSQIEICYGNSIENNHRCIELFNESSFVYTYGLNDKTDIVCGIPFNYYKNISDSTVEKAYGFSDISLEVKHCFYKIKKNSFVIKPGIIFPSGNYKNDMGSGHFNWSVFLIHSYYNNKISIHNNIGYISNYNRCLSLNHIWHISSAIDWQLKENFHPVCNFGIEKNPDKTDNTPIAFGLLGFYFLFNNDIEISTGFKHELTKPETDYSFIFGLTIRF